MIQKTNIALITLALAASGTTAFAQTNLLWSDNFDGPLSGWTPWGGQINWVAGQFVVSKSAGPYQTNSPLTTHATGLHSIPSAGPLPDNQTLELRADLVGASQNDVWAGLHFNYQSLGQGYMFQKDQDEFYIGKFYNMGNSLACFYWFLRNVLADFDGLE